MLKIYGYSDDLIEVENSNYFKNKAPEIDCYDTAARLYFTDGTVIRMQYGKPEGAIWEIKIEKEGTADKNLHICINENESIYSDVLEIDAELSQYRFCKYKEIKRDNNVS